MSVVLVDTSIWIDHLRGGAKGADLDRLLDGGFVFLHPWSLYELGLGGVSVEQWEPLETLPSPDVPDDAAVWRFVQRQGLVGRRIGWVDAGLLASAHASGMARSDVGSDGQVTLLDVPWRSPRPACPQA